MKKYSVWVFVSILAFLFLPNPSFSGTCQSSHAIQNPFTCMIGGDPNGSSPNFNRNGNQFDASVRARIYGLGGGINTNLVCEDLNGGTNDCAPHIALDASCGANSAWLNGDWFNASLGCESHTEPCSPAPCSDTYPAVTAVVIEQLSTSGTPQYFAVSLDESNQGDYAFDWSSTATPRLFENLPVTDVTSATPNGSNMDISITWPGSSYENRTGGSNLNTPNNACGTGTSGITCEHLIYGYKIVYKYTNCTGGPPCTCQQPASKEISAGGWTVDSTIRQAGCLGSSNTCGPETISIPTTPCNTADGTNCCVMVGVIHAYNGGDDNDPASQTPATIMDGWYTGGSNDLVKLTTGVLGPFIRNLQGVLEQMRDQFYVNLSWNSVVEDGVVGYKVHRACHPEGPWQVITSNPIPSTGRPGSLYTYKDFNPSCSKTRKAYYRVEILQAGGNSTLHNEIATVDLGGIRPRGNPRRAMGRATRRKGS